MKIKSSSGSIKVGAGALVVLGIAFGCGSDSKSKGSEPDGGAGTGGGSATDGGSGTGGAATGGTSANGDASTGGSPAAGGSAGDASTGGASTGDASTGDAASGGAGGTPGDGGATVDPRLIVDLTFTSLMPGEQEFIDVDALDEQGLGDTLTVTTSDVTVASGTIAAGALVITAATYGEATITVTSGSGIERTVDVVVSDPRALPLGDDLLIAFVDEFDLLYNDAGSGASKDGSFWKPRLKNGFRAVGHLARAGHDDPTGKVAMVVVKERNAGALVPPDDFTLIWNDSGSGASMHGAFWTPNCPGGYKALGSVGSENSHAKPVPDVVRCVRSDLVESGALHETVVWNDQGSGVGSDFSAWEIIPWSGTESSGILPLAAGTFLGVEGHTAPDSDSSANVLRFPIPTVRDVDVDIVIPQLTSVLPPEATTPVQLGRSVLIPFTGVADSGWTLDDKVKKSPFYRLDRDVYYASSEHGHNTTPEPVSKTVTLTTGVSQETSNSFSSTTGISVSVEGGISFLASATATVTVSTELGYSTSTTIGEFVQDSDMTTLVYPPHGAAVLWMLFHRFTLKRRNGNNWETVGVPYAVPVNSIVIDQYPD